MTPVNIKQIQIRNFKQEINETLAYGDVIYFQGKASVTDIHGTSNEDGTQNVVYVAKCQLCDARKSKDEVSQPVSITNDKRIKEKSRSQHTKQLAYRVSQETGQSEDGLYNLAMDAADELLQSKLDQR